MLILPVSGIFGDHPTTGSQIGAAVEVMPLWRGKLVEIDLILGHLVLENRAAFDLLNGYGLVRRKFFSPGIKIIYAA